MATKSRRFAPRLECLDDRSLPAVMVDLIGSTLVITGDSGANSVTISDSGQLGSVDPETGVRSGGLTVVADGVEYWFGTQVSAIVVNTYEGDDSVLYALTGPLSATRLVSVDLGRGDDSFTADLTGQTISGAGTSLGISAYGGGGRDTLVLNAVGTTVAPEALLSVELYGQAGKDAITFNHSWGDTLPSNVTLTKDQKR